MENVRPNVRPNATELRAFAARAAARQKKREEAAMTKDRVSNLRFARKYRPAYPYGPNDERWDNLTLGTHIGNLRRKSSTLSLNVELEHLMNRNDHPVFSNSPENDLSKNKSDDVYDGGDEDEDDHQMDYDNNGGYPSHILLPYKYAEDNDASSDLSERDWEEGVHRKYTTMNASGAGILNQLSTLAQPPTNGQAVPLEQALGVDAHPTYQNHDDVFAGFFESFTRRKESIAEEPSAIGQRARNKDSIWNLLDAAKATNIDEDLPDADAESQSLVPAGLNWATKQTKQVPEYQPQMISQAFDRHLSHEATVDTLVDMKVDEKVKHGPLSNSRSRFTRDLLSELNELDNEVDEDGEGGPFSNARGRFTRELLSEINEIANEIDEDGEGGPLSNSRSRMTQHLLDKLNELHREVKKDASTVGVAVANRKNLFGPKGLLGPLNPVSTKGVSGNRVKKSPREKRGLHQIRRISSKVKRLTDINPSNPFAQRTQLELGVAVPMTLTRINLSPWNQAKLYSDLEMLICTTANEFLVNQYHNDRICPHSIKKVKHAWASKNRPPVKEFRFDQTTQRQLIDENRRSIHFTGEFTLNPALIGATMLEWRGIALEMGVRTYAQPDSAIRKTVRGIENVLNLLNATPRNMQGYRYLARWVMAKIPAPERYDDPSSPDHPFNISVRAKGLRHDGLVG